MYRGQEPSAGPEAELSHTRPKQQNTLRSRFATNTSSSCCHLFLNKTCRSNLLCSVVGAL